MAGRARRATREGRADAPLAPELVGREVSVRVLQPLIEAARERAVDPARLASGTGHTITQLTSPRLRISWAAFSQFVANLGEVLLDDELVALGGRSLESPMIRALLVPGRLLFTVADAYRWVFGPRGPGSQLFCAHTTAFDELAAGGLRLVVTMRPGYAPSRENNLLLRGSLIGFARALGVGPAHVTQTDRPDGSTYDIGVPATRAPLAWMRRGWSWVFAARENAAALLDANAELHRLNEELEQRVAERTAALATANRELIAFGYSVAHDLRAPLRAIVGFSEALGEDHHDAIGDRGRDFIRRIRGAAAQMGELIDGLLELSRVNQGELQHDAINLTGVARAVVEELEHTDPGRRVAVELAPDLSAHGDSRLVRLVLHNLVGNAWKYTRRIDEPRIEVGARDGAFFVRDNGPGFAMEHAARLFQPFERLHGPEYPGSGIGLATVRRIVERHGGRVWAEGVPGAGATFWFTLP